MRTQLSMLAVALGALTPTAARAVALSVGHSGYVLDANDAPLDGTIALVFKVFPNAVPSAGETPIWSGACSTGVKRGFYAVTLGGSCGAGLEASHLPPDAGRWLEVYVGAVVMQPRLALTNAPNATTATRSLDTMALAGALGAAGTINAASNPVAWTALRGVPASIADGVDSDTTYAAGTGLALASNTFAIAEGGVAAASLASDAASLAKVSGGLLAAGGALTVKGNVTQQLPGGASYGTYRTDMSGNIGIDTRSGAAVSINYDPNARGGVGLFEVFTGTSSAPRLTVATSGNVGIGSGAPAYKLDVAGVVNATELRVGGVPIAQSPWASGAALSYSGGRVGIGTSAPVTTLEVVSAQPSSTLHPYRAGLIASGESTDVGGRLAARHAGTDAPWFIGYRSRGTLAAPTAVQAGDTLLGLLGSGSDGTAFNGHGNGGAVVTAQATETWNAAARGASLSFMTTPNGTTASQAVLTLDQDGKADLRGTLRQTTSAGATSDTIVTTVNNPANGTWYPVASAMNMYAGFSAFVNAIYEDDNADSNNRSMLAHAGGWARGGEAVAYLSRPNGAQIELRLDTGVLQVRQTQNASGASRLTVSVQVLRY